jgi:hypothetical protein
MAKTYKTYLPEQDLLLPPSLRAWLPENHLVSLLGIISEIEMFGNFKNKEQATKVWTLLSAYNPDAKDVYEMRYRASLA